MSKIHIVERSPDQNSLSLRLIINLMEKLKNQLKEIIVTGLKLHDITPDEIRDNEPLFEDGLGLDSLDAVELVVLLNKNFGIQIQNMEEGKTAFESVNTLAEFVNKRKQQQPQ